MIKEKAFPNFWQALLIIACWWTTNLIIYYFTLKMIFYHKDSVFYESIQIILMELNFIPYIVFLIRKTKIRIWDNFTIPDFGTLFKLIIVGLLIRFVISIPLNKPVEYFNLLMDSKIKFLGINLDNKTPEYVIALRWIFFPITEEILYRGLILGAFLKRYSPTKAILLSSVLFCFAHLRYEDLAGLLVGGIILGIVYYKTKSLLASSIPHYIFNMSIILKSKYLDLNIFNMTMCIVFFIISILIIIFLLRKQMNTVKINNLTFRE